jgi:hypothetical protein
LVEPGVREKELMAATVGSTPRRLLSEKTAGYGTKGKAVGRVPPTAFAVFADGRVSLSPKPKDS